MDQNIYIKHCIDIVNMKLDCNADYFEGTIVL